MLLREFAQQFPVQQYSAGSVIAGRKDSRSPFYYLMEGVVKLSFTAGSGQTVTLHLYFPGSLLPLLQLLPDYTPRYDLVAITPIAVSKIPHQEFTKAITSDSEMMQSVTERLLRGIQGLLTRIEQLTTNSAYQQVASMVLYFARHFGESTEHSPTSRRIQIKVTHQQLAEWLGLTRENVSIHMKQLERDGYITIIDHRIEIPDLERLQSLADAI